MVERVTDCLRGRTARGQFRDLGYEPDAQVRDQRLTLGLAEAQPVGGALAANLGLDFIECGDALQRLDRDRRLRFGQIIKAAAHMAPAESQRYGRLSRARPDETLVCSISVTLQDPAVTAEQRIGVSMPSTRCVIINHRRRIVAAPWPIVTGDRPEVALFGFPAAWVEHRNDGR